MTFVSNLRYLCNYSFGNLQVVLYTNRFLEFGVDLSSDSADAITPLMAVCSGQPRTANEADFEPRQVRCAELLIDVGKVDVDARQSQKMTALM